MPGLVPGIYGTDKADAAVRVDGRGEPSHDNRVHHLSVREHMNETAGVFLTPDATPAFR